MAKQPYSSNKQPYHSRERWHRRRERMLMLVMFVDGFLCGGEAILALVVG